MVIMFASFLLNLLALTSSNIDCLDIGCSKCTQGYLFDHLSCLPVCPTGYSTSNQVCIPSDSQEVFLANFFEFSTFSANKFKNFSHPDLIPFNDSNRSTPVPTKSQGFYFNNKSRLDLNTGLMISPSFCLSMALNSFQDGIIFQVVKNSITYFSLSSKNFKLYVEIRYTNGNSDKIFVLDSDLEINKWVLFRIINTQWRDSVLLNIPSSDSLSVKNYEFRVPFTDVNFVFGSLNHTTFKGFIYYSRLLNSRDCMIPPSFNFKCEINQYLYKGNCYECQNHDMWPPCVRNSTNLCFSELCEICTGFDQSECNYCKNQELDSCMMAKNCVLGSGFKCTECQSNSSLVNGLCVQNSILSTNINLKLDHSSGRYGDFFKSGKNESTYYFLNNPEKDDPIPSKNRGLYFNISHCLESDEVALNINLTLSVWTFASLKSTIIKKSSFNLWSDATFSVKLSNYNDYITTQILNYCGYNEWKFLAVIIQFSGNSTTLKSQCDGNYLEIITINGYAFYDDLSIIEIKPTQDIFLYKIVLFPFTIENFDTVSRICDEINYNSSCLLIGKFNQYYNEYLKKYNNCDQTCKSGCNNWGTCNICKNLTCDKCHDFNSNCSSNFSFNPCLSNTSFNLENSSCCHTACYNCYERFIHTCFHCKEPYYYLDHMCYKNCPAGFLSLQKNCTLKQNSGIIAFFQFNKTVLDENNSSEIHLMIRNETEAIRISPIPAKNRGFYFKGYSVMHSNSFLLPHSVEIGFWLMQIKPGTIFSKGDLWISTTGNITLSNKFIDFGLLSSNNTWIRYIIMIELHDTYTLVKRTQGTLTKFMAINDFVFYDSKSLMKIGNPTNSFTGFIYSFSLIWKNSYSISYPACSNSIVNNCTWNCSIDSFFNGSNCELCESKCTEGCVRKQGCSLCASELCEKCVNYTGPCQECKENTIFQQGNCSCNEGYFWNASQDLCEPCMDGCKTCFNQFSCIECKDSFTKDAENKCSCNEGFFWNASQDLCEPCIDECKTCSNQFSCIECKDSLTKDAENKCSCNEGFFWNASQDLCESCMDECKTCFNQFSCIECKYPLTKNAGNKCSCSEGYFWNASQDLCEPCMDGCKTCFNQSSCIECKYSLTKDAGNKCSCNESLFWNSSLGLCDSCIDGCKTCSNQSSCIDCKFPLNLISGSCKCDSGEYLTKEINQNSSGFTYSCSSCHSSCLECDGPGSQNCTSCNHKRPPLNNSCSCLSGTFENTSECSNCSQFCEECQNFESCLICKTGFKNINGSCDCPKNKYIDGLQCHDCSANCLECSITSTNCTVCNENFYLTENSTCQCIEGFFQSTNSTNLNNSSEICSPCKNFCSNCNNSFTCDSCFSPLQLLNNSCVCPQGMFFDGKVCNDCHESCFECFSGSEKACLSCRTDFHFQDNSNCECLPGFYRNGKNCLKCHDSCLTCSGEFYFNCEKCEKFFMNGTCYESCPLGYAEDGFNCTLREGLAIGFSFSREYPVLQELKTKSFAELCFNETQLKAYDNKGIYFDGRNCLNFQSNGKIFFGQSLFVYIWIKSMSSSDFLYYYSTEGFGFSLNAEVQMKYSVNINGALKSQSTQNNIEYLKWNHLVFGINFTKETQIFTGINDFIDSVQLLSVFPYKDSNNSTLILGSNNLFTSFFKGFLYSLRVFNYFLGLEVDIMHISNVLQCKIHPAQLNTCLDECGPDQVLENNSCIECSGNCQSCSTLNCFVCDNLERRDCLECLNGFELNGQVCEECSSFQYFDGQFKKCFDCQKLCLTCESFEKCLTCDNNSELLSNLSCGCMQGFALNDSKCQQLFFKAFLIVHFNNSFTIKFEKNLKSILSKDSLKISINEIKTEYKITTKDLSEYIFELLLSFNLNSTKAELKIEFTKTIKSSENYILITEILEGELLIHQNEVSNIDVVVISESAKATAMAAGGVAASSGLLSFNPAGLFNLLNLIEIFIYSLLFDVEFHQEFENFIHSLQASSKIPNFFPKLVKPSTKLPSKFKESGISCSYFSVNAANSLIVFFILIVLTVVSKIFQRSTNLKMKNIGIYFKKKLVFDYYLRFFIQFSFDMTVFAILSIVYTERDEAGLIFDICISFIVLVIFMQVFEILSLALIIRAMLKIFYKSLSKETLNEILQEFNTEKISSSYYYILFILRRLITSALIFLTHDPFLQVIGSFLLAFIVIVKKVLIYLIATKPFKCKRMLIFQILNEAHIATFYLVLLVRIAMKKQNNPASSQIFIILILSSLANNAIFNALDGLIKIGKWVRGRCINNGKVSPVLDFDSGDIIKTSNTSKVIGLESKIV